MRGRAGTPPVESEDTVPVLRTNEGRSERRRLVKQKAAALNQQEILPVHRRAPCRLQPTLTTLLYRTTSCLAHVEPRPREMLMTRWIARPTVALVLAVCAAFQLAACSSPLETVRLPAVGDAWEVGYSRDFGEGQGVITEFIPVGESMESWTRRITIQFLEGSTRTPEQGMSELRRAVQGPCPRSHWFVLDRRPNSILYEWSVFGCDGQQDQHEIARLLRGNDGLHRVAYTEKGTSMDPTSRALWLDRIALAVLIKGEEQEPVAPERGIQPPHHGRSAR
jgi:hypothetical protein